MSAENDVFQWLGTDSRGTPYHLHPLNLVWSDEGVSFDLAVYRRVANRLAAHPRYWSLVIRDSNWRSTLVGCVCLLVSGERHFKSDLRDTFYRGSMVEPQLAVSFGLLHPDEAKSFFQSFIAAPSSRNRPRALVSAQRVLQCLGLLSESDLTLTGWDALGQDDAVLANQVALQHWTFWSSCR